MQLTPQGTPQLTPTKIEPNSPTEMLIEWNDGSKFAIPYVEIRFYCPCAGCIDEHTGKRTLDRSSVSPDIKPKAVQAVGRYAIQITWSDGHETGIFHFDRLKELSDRQGRRI